MKCKVCGSEFVSETKCPFCGSAVTSTPKPTKIKEEPKEEKKTESASASPQDILSKIDEAKTMLVEKCRKSVVKIYCIFDGYQATGSGFVVDGGYIVTNCHVVTADDNERFRLKIEYSDMLKLGSVAQDEAKIVYKSAVDDIAILKPKLPIPRAVPALKIEPSKTKQGELVFTIGNPLHYKFTYMEGSVANPEYVKEDSKSKYSYLQTTLTLNHGNSGGPVYNTSGDVVGMTTFGERRMDFETEEITDILGYGFCVSAKAIIDAIKKVK